MRKTLWLTAVAALALVAQSEPDGAAAQTRSAAETVLSASTSVDTSVGKLRDEIESFLKKVAV